MHSFDITMENLSKMEGHANLDVKVRDGRVEDVEFKIMENQRFYEQAVRGQPITTAPQLMSRICGTCSIAHLTCCIEAIEKGVGIIPTDQSLLMKKLAMYGLMIRDHALHLYFFSLPDLIGKDSILDFSENDEKEHKLLHDSFDVKRAGNALSTLIAGKAVHAPYPTVGGFLHTPDQAGVEKTIKELKYARPLVMNLIDLFYNWNEKLERDTDFVGLVTNDYSFIEGKVRSSRGICIREQDYLEHLIRVVIPYSQAPGFEFEGEEFMVGALARMNLNKDALHPETKKSAERYLKAFPCNNIFYNNLAQAIEILHSIDHSVELLENTKFKQEEIQKPVIKEEDIGIGVIEAPRGTLYYKLTIGTSGKIKKANVIVPTAQNQINIEKDIAKLVENNLDKPKEKIEYELEKLIRAYDPCLSCASHFLKVKWL
ncbi:MAG: nickel-dependent hydrogenase large subunit [Candidatus Aenigmarchaeota archaeon]|nr:nickel-dependent hydrogenase large subunit [Candidatus Aenigmarchaeota archaeon]